MDDRTITAMLLDDIAPSQSNEIAPFHANYVGKVSARPLRATLERQREDARELLGGLDNVSAMALHGPYTWTSKQVIGHVTDAERVFSYRLMCIARGEQTPLPGFDENAYAAASNANDVPIAALLAEFLAVRESTLTLLRNLPATVAERRGIASGSSVTVRTFAYVIAGHAEHHLTILRRRLKG